MIKYVVDMVSQQEPSQDNQFYNILIIITRGVIADEAKVLEQIVRASHYPLSIIIVGVGQTRGKKFNLLEYIDGEKNEDGGVKDRHGNAAVRDIV